MDLNSNKFECALGYHNFELNKERDYITSIYGNKFLHLCTNCKKMRISYA